MVLSVLSPSGDLSSSNKSSSSTAIIIGAAVGGSVLLLLLLVAGGYAFRQKRRAEIAAKHIDPFGNLDIIMFAVNFLKSYSVQFSPSYFISWMQHLGTEVKTVVVFLS